MSATIALARQEYFGTLIDDLTTGADMMVEIIAVGEVYKIEVESRTAATSFMKTRHEIEVARYPTNMALNDAAVIKEKLK